MDAATASTRTKPIVEPDALADSCTAKMSRLENPFWRSAGSSGRLLRFLYFLSTLGAEVVAMLDVLVFLLPLPACSLDRS